MDYSYDPCSCIDEIDFDNINDLKKILSRDKHTRIEGICVEGVFIDDLVKESFDEFSTGWWFPTKNWEYRVVKILFDWNELSDLDKEILLFFKSKKIPTFLVSFDQNENVFYYIKIEENTLIDLESNWNEKKKIYPRSDTTPPLPQKRYRDKNRLDKSIKILESLNILKRSSIERILANCWIRAKGLWDIDTFIKMNGEIIGLEVKQKYPTRSGTFGLNKGLSKLFKFLTGIGIRVVHIILTKPKSDKAIPATDFYTLQQYEGKSLWIGTNFSDEILSSGSSSAPTETSIFTNTRLKFHHIQPGSFTKLKIFGEKKPKVLKKFLNGELEKLNGLSDIPQI